MNNGKKKAANLIPNNETKLPEVIDRMAMLQMDNDELMKPSENSSSIQNDASNSKENSDVSVSNTRSLRKRISRECLSSEDVKETLNRRFSLRPKKRAHEDMKSEEEIKDYYLDKRIKKIPNSLETIFEEDNNSNEYSVRIGKKKMRRIIRFEDLRSSSKLKKRQIKIKLLGKTLPRKRNKISMETVINKLNSSHTEFTNQSDSNTS